MQQPARPAKITQNLLLQAVGDETLIYDEQRHLTFCLDRLASAIWQNADGTRTVQQITSACRVQLDLPVEEDAVILGLDQLEQDGLLEQAAETEWSGASAVAGMLSRRAMVGQAGMGAVMMVPVIAAVFAPKAAQAYGCFDCSDAEKQRSRKAARVQRYGRPNPLEANQDDQRDDKDQPE